MKLRRNMLPPAILPAVPEHALLLDPYTRVSKVPFHTVFRHRTDGRCRCGCGAPTPPSRSSWATDDCERGAVWVYWLWKGDPTAMRTALWRRDKGCCARCKCPPAGTTLAAKKSAWDAHHKLPVEEGGGRLGVDNMETLCQTCHGTHHHGHAPAAIRAEHKPATATEKQRRKAARQRSWKTRGVAARHSRHRR